MNKDTINTTFKIMENAYGKEKFIAYLQGNIIQSTLEKDVTMVKLYADKLEQVLHKGKTITQKIEELGREFEIGDHVIVSKGTMDERTGVIIRLPMEGVDCCTSYVVELDDKNLGWNATKAVDGVDCNNAWVASAKNMELLEG